MLNYSFTLLAALGIGLAVGGGFAFIAGDRGAQIVKTMAIATICSLLGWVLGMAIPVIEFRGYASDGLALIGSLWGSHGYWAAIKRRSNVVKQIDIIPTELLHSRRS